MIKNPYFFSNDDQKVYEFDYSLKKYQLIGYYSTFGINEEMLMSEKINKVVMFGVI